MKRQAQKVLKTGGSCAKCAILLADVGLQETEKMVKWVWKLFSGRNNFSRFLKILWTFAIASVPYHSFPFPPSLVMSLK